MGCGDETVRCSCTRIAEAQGYTDLVEYLMPDIFGPVGRNGSQDEGLQLDISENQIAVHRDSSRSGGFTIEISGADEVVKGILQSSLEICSGE